MFEVGDAVSKIGDNRVGHIVRIIADVAIVEYVPKGERAKVPLKCLVKKEPEKRVTEAQFDAAVTALMHETTDDAENDDQLEFILELIGVIGGKLKERLFNGND